MSIETAKIVRVNIAGEWIGVHEGSFEILPSLAWTKDGTSEHAEGAGYRFKLQSGGPDGGQLQAGPLSAIVAVRTRYPEA